MYLKNIIYLLFFFEYIYIYIFFFFFSYNILIFFKGRLINF